MTQVRVATLSHYKEQLESLGCNPDRVLSENGTSFTKLLETLRKKHAVSLLQSGHTSTAQIAKQLGYSDTTAFLRAFKRWHNMTPKAWTDLQIRDSQQVTERNPLR
jgi:AraC-like DNA-binding protein